MITLIYMAEQLTGNTLPRLDEESRRELGGLHQVDSMEEVGEQVKAGLSCYK